VRFRQQRFSSDGADDRLLYHGRRVSRYRHRTLELDVRRHQRRQHGKLFGAALDNQRHLRYVQRRWLRHGSGVQPLCHRYDVGRYRHRSVELDMRRRQRRNNGKLFGAVLGNRHRRCVRFQQWQFINQYTYQLMLGRYGIGSFQ
jgi:hypothetical protein